MRKYNGSDFTRFEKAFQNSIISYPMHRSSVKGFYKNNLFDISELKLLINAFLYFKCNLFL